MNHRTVNHWALDDPKAPERPAPLPAEQLPRPGELVWLLTERDGFPVVHLFVVKAAGVGALRRFTLVAPDGAVSTALPEDFFSASGPLAQGFYVVNPLAWT